jgi:hypothetical protein
MGRLVAAFVSFGGAVIFTFWRVEGVYTLEEELFNRLRFARRPRRYVRGGVKQHRLQRIGFAEKTTPKERQVFLKVPATWIPQSNEELLARVLSLAGFVILLAWVGRGGVTESQKLVSSFL